MGAVCEEKVDYIAPPRGLYDEVDGWLIVLRPLKREVVERKYCYIQRAATPA